MHNQPTQKSANLDLGFFSVIVNVNRVKKRKVLIYKIGINISETKLTGIPLAQSVCLRSSRVIPYGI